MSKPYLQAEALLGGSISRPWAVVRGGILINVNMRKTYALTILTKREIKVQINVVRINSIGINCAIKNFILHCF